VYPEISYLPAERLLPGPISKLEFFKRTVIVVAVALIPVMVWLLVDVILIALGAVLMAVLLHLIAEPFRRWLRLPEAAALVLSGTLTITVIAATAYLFGVRIEAELQDVMGRAGSALTTITTQMQHSPGGKLILAHLQGGSLSIANIFSISASFIEAVIITLIAGFYLAAQPKLYRRGLDKLFPGPCRTTVDETIEDIGQALRLWLIGELMQMALIGALTLAAVWTIGLSSPLALAAIAGLAEFVPYLGPIIAAIPALLVATTQGLDTLLWTLFAYILIHQIEGNLIAPLIQRRMVFIPPALLLLAIVTILFLFGTVAVIFAAPITVIIVTAVKKLYVRDSLGEPTVLPGETR
jgi:predicted PurR-regulated permease PerM